MQRMQTLALKGIAKVTSIDIPTAVRTTRQNPILDTEIHIDEELINLKESLDSYHTAGATLNDYPTIRSHILIERRTIMQHCIGLVVRMLYGKKLPYDYTQEDIDHAIRQLVHLIIIDCRRAGQRIDRDIMEVFQPFMTVRQRLRMRMRT